MKNTNKKPGLASFLCLLLLSVGSAQAAMVNFSLTGQITIAETSNPFNLLVGDEVIATGVFDDSSNIYDPTPGSGLSYIDFSTSYNNLQITIGSVSYTDSDDILSAPVLYFLDNIDGSSYLDGFTFRAERPEDSFSSTGENDFLFNGGLLDINNYIIDGTYIDGQWDAGSFVTTAAVPVPAAAWLFGSGLAFLTGLIGKRKNKR